MQWVSIDKKLVQVAIDEGVTCVQVNDHLDIKCERGKYHWTHQDNTEKLFSVEFTLSRWFTVSLSHSFTGAD